MATEANTKFIAQPANPERPLVHWAVITVDGIEAGEFHFVGDTAEGTQPWRVFQSEKPLGSKHTATLWSMSRPTLEEILQVINFNYVPDGSCGRCQGRGHMAEFGHVYNGICFECNGTGLAPEVETVLCSGRSCGECGECCDGPQPEEAE